MHLLLLWESPTKNHNFDVKIARSRHVLTKCFVLYTLVKCIVFTRKSKCASGRDLCCENAILEHWSRWHVFHDFACGLGFLTHSEQTALQRCALEAHACHSERKNYLAFSIFLAFLDRYRGEVQTLKSWNSIAFCIKTAKAKSQNHVKNGLKFRPGRFGPAPCVRQMLCGL